MISEFQGEYRWLSNFWLVDVVLDGVTYPTVEHAYQAAKFLSRQIRQDIAACSRPGLAKQRAKSLAVRPGWHDMKDGIMLGLLRQKFAHPELRAKLLETGDQALVEGNMWHDTFWGVCHCSSHHGEGRNRLGCLLVQVRSELKKEVMP